MKKVITGLMVLMLLVLIPGMSAKADTFGDFKYEVVEGNVRITKYNGIEAEVTVPETIGGKKVTEIGDEAFNYCNNLSAINFPSSLKIIGKNAFESCRLLAGVEFPAGLERIEGEAFVWCTSLSQVSIPDSVTYIGNEAFENTPWLKSQKEDKKNVVVKNHLLWCECPENGKVVVPEGVTYILENFFQYSLVSTIVLPNSLKEIKDNAFAHCVNLSSIVIPSEVTSIGEGVFAGDDSLNFIFYPKNVADGGSGLSSNTTEFIYSIEDNKAVIGEIKKLGEKTEITVPAEISGYTVAFSDGVKTNLKGIKINHTHVGGTPTCTKEAVCLICGEEYGEFAPHEYSTEWTTDGTSHWHECTACGDKKDISDHTLKTTTTKATLTTDGKLETKCSVCNKTKTTPIYAASNISLLKDTAAYTGKVQKPKAVVKDSKGNVIDAANYTLTLPSGLKKVGSYKVKVTLKGDLYEGSKTLTFKINPAKTKLSSVKAGSKSMTVKWAGKTTEVTGYEIRYSLKKDFKGAKSVLVKSAKSTSKEIKKLKAKKTYYVQIRTYKTVKGKKYYSDWSATKKVKIKN